MADAAAYGIRIGLNVTRHLETEVEWLRSETRHEFSIGVTYPGPLTLDFFMASAAWNFGEGRTRPYVAIGLGASRWDNGFVQTNFTGSAAVGLKTFLSSRFGFRLDARGYASHLGYPPLGAVCSTYTEVPGGDVSIIPCPYREWVLTPVLSAGLLIAF